MSSYEPYVCASICCTYVLFAGKYVTKEHCGERRLLPCSAMVLFYTYKASLTGRLQTGRSQQGLGGVQVLCCRQSYNIRTEPCCSPGLLGRISCRKKSLYRHIGWEVGDLRFRHCYKIGCNDFGVTMSYLGITSLDLSFMPSSFNRFNACNFRSAQRGNVA